MFKTSIRLVTQLLVDDRFKMGGTMYRISEINPGVPEGSMHIRFYPIDHEPLDFLYAMTVSQDAVFKIYNLK